MVAQCKRSAPTKVDLWIQKEKFANLVVARIERKITSLNEHLNDSEDTDFISSLDKVKTVLSDQITHFKVVGTKYNKKISDHYMKKAEEWSAFFSNINENIKNMPRTQPISYCVREERRVPNTKTFILHPSV